MNFNALFATAITFVLAALHNFIIPVYYYHLCTGPAHFFAYSPRRMPCGDTHTHTHAGREYRAPDYLTARTSIKTNIDNADERAATSTSEPADLIAQWIDTAGAIARAPIEANEINSFRSHSTGRAGDFARWLCCASCANVTHMVPHIACDAGCLACVWLLRSCFYRTKKNGILLLKLDAGEVVPRKWQYYSKSKLFAVSKFARFVCAVVHMLGVFAR